LIVRFVYISRNLFIIIEFERMTRLNILFFITAVLLLTVSCKKEIEVTESTLEKALKNRLVKKSLNYTDSSGNEHKYSLSIPDDYQSQGELPVIVYLHGLGGNENSELIFFSNYIDSILAECQAVRPLIVFPSDVNRLYVLDQNYHIAIGLLNVVGQKYSLAGSEKRVISGFSNGGTGAARTPIVQPGSYVLSYSWGGGAWSRDRYLFEQVGKNAEQLNNIQFKSVLFTGDNDHAHEYAKLIDLMSQNNIQHESTILKDQKHDLGKYFSKTRNNFKKDLCRVFHR